MIQPIILIPFLILLCLAFFNDLESMLIPNYYSYPLIILGAINLLMDFHPLVLISIAIFFLYLMLLFLFKLGRGDIKILIGIALFSANSPLLFNFLMALTMIGSLYIIWIKHIAKLEIAPFMPAIFSSFLLGLALTNYGLFF